MTRALLIACLVIATLGDVRAEPAGAEAEVLFRQGRDQMAAGKIAEACKLFEQSQKVEPAVTTLLNLAGCRERLGQIATAWGLFLDAARQTRSSEDPGAQQLYAVAAEHAAKLERRVSKLTISVPSVDRIDGLEITRDADPVASVTWDRPLPIDGGTYTITARAPGGRTWSKQITIAPEGDARTVTVPELQSAPVAAKPEPELTAQTTPMSNSGESDRSDHRTLTLVLGASAVVALGSAVGFDLWGDATYDDAKAEMTDQSRRDSLYSSANTKRYVAEGAAAVGLACAGAAVWLFLHDKHDAHDRTARAPRAIVSPLGIAVVGEF